LSKKVGDVLNKKIGMIIGILLLALVVLLSQNSQLRKEIESFEDSNTVNLEMIDTKENKIDELLNNYKEALNGNKSLEEVNDSLNLRIKDLEMIDYIAKIKLEEKGIEDYRIIEEDLKEKPELISIDGVLGGTMYFTDVNLLNDQWVYATFEDGHITGSGLYEFQVVSPDEIKWQEIIVGTD